ESLGKRIAERERAEEAVEQLNRQNRMILNSAGEGIYGLDLEGRTTFVNPAAAEMIGWKAEDLIGKRQHAVLHHSKPDGTPYPREECPIYAAFKDGKVHRVDSEVFWRKDGTSFPVAYVSTPIRDERGDLAGAVVTFSDITERKQAEEALRKAHDELELRVAERTEELSQANIRLQEEVTERKRAEEEIKAQKKFTDNVIDSLPDTFYIFDAESGKGIQWNKTLNEISGYSYEEMSEYPPLHFYPPEEHQLVEEVVKT
ncbi:unnamed protein product, partial [marine sediment metagenome]